MKRPIWKQHIRTNVDRRIQCENKIRKTKLKNLEREQQKNLKYSFHPSPHDLCIAILCAKYAYSVIGQWLYILYSCARLSSIWFLYANITFLTLSTHTFSRSFVHLLSIPETYPFKHLAAHSLSMFRKQRKAVRMNTV